MSSQIKCHYSNSSQGKLQLKTEAFAHMKRAKVETVELFILIWCILSVTLYDLLIMLPPSSVIIGYNTSVILYAIITLEGGNMINTNVELLFIYFYLFILKREKEAFRGTLSFPQVECYAIEWQACI
jgi:hypothetical protein